MWRTISKLLQRKLYGTCAMRVPHIIQIVLDNHSLSFGTHLHGSAFGVVSEEKRLIYNERDGQAMRLDLWGEATAFHMVGRQEPMRIEFWTRTIPPQRPRLSDRRPNCVGFFRIGKSVLDFTGTLEWLSRRGIRIMTPAVEVDGPRRICVPDPTFGIPVEIMETGAGLPGQRDRCHDLDPTLVHVAMSVGPGGSEGLFRQGLGSRTDGWRAARTRPRDASQSRRCRTADGSAVRWQHLPELVHDEAPADQLRPMDDVFNCQGFRTIAAGSRIPPTPARSSSASSSPAWTGLLLDRGRTSKAITSSAPLLIT